MDITVTQILDNKTAAASGSTAIADCTEVDLSEVINLGIGVLLTFNASATAGATVEVYGAYDGTNYTSEPLDEYDVELSAGNTVKVAFLSLVTTEKIKVVVKNNDTSQSITGISVWVHTQV